MIIKIRAELGFASFFSPVDWIANTKHTEIKEEAHFHAEMRHISLPALVEAATAVVAQMLRKDGLELAQTLRCVNVAHNSDDHHRGRLQNGHGINGFLLVEFYGEKTRKISDPLTTQRTSYPFAVHKVQSTHTFRMEICRVMKRNASFFSSEKCRKNNLLEPVFSTSRTTWVMPALNPRKAVRWIGFFWSSLGKALTRPRIPFALRLGQNPMLPCRGAENLRWDWKFLKKIRHIRNSCNFIICATKQFS